MNNNRLIGERIINNTINIEEALTEILKVEVKRLKKLAKTDNTLEELQITNRLINNIIITFMLTDERIRIGVDLCMDNSEINNP